jgi:thiol-disulfide isomerase/thioredoxin
MKKLTIISGIILLFIFGCKTSKPTAGLKQEVKDNSVPVSDITPKPLNYSDQVTWVLGYFKLDRLTSEPHNAWYLKGFDDYMINSNAVNQLLDISKDNLKIKIVMGTWCPDSRREVPRFMRILDIWRFPLSEVVFIGVDNSKLSPVAEYESLKIQRVPTFIFYKNNIEVGRIIENPVTSLEQDMVNILTRNE